MNLQWKFEERGRLDEGRIGCNITQFYDFLSSIKLNLGRFLN